MFIIISTEVQPNRSPGQKEKKKEIETDRDPGVPKDDSIVLRHTQREKEQKRRGRKRKRRIPISLKGSPRSPSKLPTRSMRTATPKTCLSLFVIPLASLSSSLPDAIPCVVFCAIF